MMQRRTLLLATLGLGLVADRAGAATLEWRHRPLLGLGTTLNLRAAHIDATQAEHALDAAVAGIRAVEASMSLFQPGSELVRLNRDGQLRLPSAHLLRVLRESQAVASRSQGAFDPTVQPLWLAHERARAAGRLPSAAERAAARAQIGWHAIELHDDLVRFKRPGMALTLNGIAQGYAADVATAALRAHGVEHALIDTGEFASVGRNAHGQPWTLGVEDPLNTGRLIAALRCDGRSIATSAGHRGAFSTDGRHHHLFDPATGASPQALSSVSVAAGSAMRADALTKVMFVAGPQRIPALAREWQVGVLWVDRTGRWGATPDLHMA